MSPDNIKESTSSSKIDSDEVDLIALAKTFWSGRKVIVKTALIFMVLGLFVAVFSAKEYTANTTIIPQSASGGSKLGGGLGGLAAMAGISLGSMGGGSEIPPALYSKIMKSVPFQKKMMETLITTKGQKEKVTFRTYYLEIEKLGLLGNLKKYTIGLPFLILKTLRGDSVDNDEVSINDQLLTISEDEKELMEKLSEQLLIEVNDKDGDVSISASMPEAKQAAEMALKAQVLLQEAIIDFKIKKAKDQLSFIEERYVEKEIVFLRAQEKLARFRDQNKNVRTAMAKSQMERLKTEFSIASSVFSELAKQLETQKIQVKENTPVFTVIEPVAIPLDKSKPHRSIILIVWTFVGVVVGVGLVFGKQFMTILKKQW